MSILHCSKSSSTWKGLLPEVGLLMDWTLELSPSVLPKQGFGSRGTHPGISPVFHQEFLEIVKIDQLTGLLKKLFPATFAVLQWLHFLHLNSWRSELCFIYRSCSSLLITLIVKYVDSSGKFTTIPKPSETQIKRICRGCPYLNTFKNNLPRFISFVPYWISSVTSPKCSKMISAFESTPRDSMNLNEFSNLILISIFRNVCFFSHGKCVSCVYINICTISIISY